MSSRFATFLAATLSIFAVTTAMAADYQFDVLDPAHYPQLSDSWLWDINDNGDATGYIQLATNGDFEPVIFRNGVVEVLPVPFGSNLSPGVTLEIYQNLGLDINSSRQVLGQYADSTPSIPASSQSIGLLTSSGPVEFPVPANFQNIPGPSTVYNFPFPPVPVDFNRASLTHETGKLASLNNLGQAVFEGAFDNNTEGIVFYDGVESGRLNFLSPAFPNGDLLFSSVFKLTGLTDSGLFGVTVDEFDLGTTDEVLHHYAVDITAGAFVPLEVPAGADDIAIDGIDQAGQVFGYSFDGVWFDERTPLNLVLWNSDGSIAETIPLPAGAILPNSFHRNNLGQIIGATGDGAVLYSSDSWSTIESLGLDPQYDGLSVLAFNDLGQFIGLVRDDSGNFLYAYVATPVPEPTAFTLAGLAAIAFAKRQLS